MNTDWWQKISGKLSLVDASCSSTGGGGGGG
jgi:hypothetical protein